MRTILLTLTLAMFIFGCKQKSEVAAVVEENITEGKETLQEIPTPKIMLDPAMGKIESDPITLEGAYVEGDILHLQVQYGGGCKDHEFELKGTGMHMKSLPPQTTIVLDHNANEDMCRALISKNLEFNIKALQYPGSQKLIIHLTGFPDRIEYTY